MAKYEPYEFENCGTCVHEDERGFCDIDDEPVWRCQSSCNREGGCEKGFRPACPSYEESNLG
ncbi:MAG: hypothetical protein A4E53_01946 [Pelotomaculum sp. PtaB.Bin104]|nr:MAG: hypothetical protein A4E53_01946 [Pelotomaculum sp. PtaB.Bin104]